MNQNCKTIVVLCWLATTSQLSNAQALDTNKSLSLKLAPQLNLNSSSVQTQKNKPQTAKHLSKNTTSSDKTRNNETISDFSDDVIELPEVNIKGKRIRNKRIDKTKTITTITKKEIDRKQPTSIFDVVKDVPGVSVNGGPRPAGMRFNIRGYSENEDVVTKVDGVIKGLDKYRMGSGIFIEPELLKSIEVQRGPQIASGSGALGGTVLASTKSAADYLKGDEKLGGRAKFGYGNNSDEYLRSYTAYALPHERVDLLYNYAKRTATDYTDGAGDVVTGSDMQSESHLLKLVLYPRDDLALTSSIVAYDSTQFAPFDVVSSQPGLFGFVTRTVDERTYSQQIHFTPDSDWVDLTVNIGHGHTNMFEALQRGDALIWPTQPSCSDGGTGVVNTAGDALICTGDRLDDYRFENTNLDIQNTALIYDTEHTKLSLFSGYQYIESDQNPTRTVENTTVVLPGAVGSLPKATKTVHAIYLQPTLNWRQLTVIPGVRYDYYTTSANDETKEAMKTAGEQSKIAEKFTTYSLGLVYDIVPDNISIFANYAQGARPPLMNEYFTSAAFSNCLSVFMPQSGPDTGICGDLYEPETSENYEIGAHYQTNNFLNLDIQLFSKLTFFEIETKNLIESLGETASGEIVQRGREKRRGVEFESRLDYQEAYTRLAYSHVSGYQVRDIADGGFVYTSSQKIPLFTAPANRLNVTLGYAPSAKLDFSFNYEKVWSRPILTDFLSGRAVLDSFGKQDGYELFSYGVYYAPSEHINFRLVGENIFDKAYNLDSGFGSGIGLPGIGRNIKFYAELIY